MYKVLNTISTSEVGSIEGIISTDGSVAVSSPEMVEETIPEFGRERDGLTVELNGLNLVLRFLLELGLDLAEEDPI